VTYQRELAGNRFAQLALSLDCPMVSLHGLALYLCEEAQIPARSGAPRTDDHLRQLGVKWMKQNAQ